MILAILIYQIKLADCEYHLSARWHSFKERHIIADDPYDELTRKHNEEKNKESGENNEHEGD